MFILGSFRKIHHNSIRDRSSGCNSLKLEPVFDPSREICYRDTYNLARPCIATKTAWPQFWSLFESWRTGTSERTLEQLQGSLPFRNFCRRLNTIPSKDTTRKLTNNIEDHRCSIGRDDVDDHKCAFDPLGHLARTRGRPEDLSAHPKRQAGGTGRDGWLICRLF